MAGGRSSFSLLPRQDLSMDFEVLSQSNQLAALRPDWGQLRCDSPMQSYDWLAAWWDCYQDDSRELFVVVARERGALVGVAPWYIRKSRNRNVVRWLGDGRVCSDHPTLLCSPTAGPTCEEFAIGLAEWLINECKVSWNELKLEAIDTDNTTCAHFINALVAEGCLQVNAQEPGNCFVDLPSTFEDYLMSVSKNHRKRCRRWGKQMFETGRASVEVATTPETCLAHWQTLVKLHNDRRSQFGQEGAFLNPDFAAFHRQAIAKLAESGNVQLRVLEIDGEPVAAEYLLQDEQTWYAYQSGMSELGEELSAGSLSILKLVQDAIAAGCTRLDLLRGEEPYKFSWGAVHRPALTTTLRRQSYTAQLMTMRDLAWSSAKWVKQTLVN